MQKRIGEKKAMCYYKNMKRENILKTIFAGLLFVLTLCVCLTNFNVEKVNAETVPNATGETDVVHLLGKTSENRFSHFTSFTQSGIKAGKSYNSKTGTQVSDRWVITNSILTNPLATDKRASGNGEYVLSSDLKKIAQNAKLYVYATFGAEKPSSSSNGNLTFRISHGSESALKSSTTKTISWSTTGSVLISSENIESPIYFSYAVQGYETGGGVYLYDPCLNFVAEVDEITSNMKETRNVYTGQTLKLRASNSILDLDGGNTIDAFKEKFKISWSIIEGNSLATLADNNLTITGSTGTIKIQAKCLKNSNSTQYITKTFVLTIGKTIGIECDFDNALENVEISQNGENFDLSATIKEGYEFVANESFEGENFNPETRILTKQSVSSGTTLKVDVKKQVSISEIVVKEKVYDGTTTAEIEKIVFGKENQHDVSISGISAVFSEKSVGSNVVFSGAPVLSGEHTNLYVLTVNSEGVVEIPTSESAIIKKDVIVSANEAKQDIGSSAVEITYETEGLISEEKLEGALSRENATDLSVAGEYTITIGTLNDQNPNYNIIFRSNTYTIKKRTITISQITFEKTYDGTTSLDGATISATFKYDGNKETSNFDIAKGTLNVSLSDYTGSFSDKNVGQKKTINNLKAVWFGNDKDNVEIVIDSSNVIGKINKRNVSITIDSAKKIYGDKDPIFTYKYDESSLEFCVGDSQSGSFKRENTSESVGSYVISQGTFTAGGNYALTVTSTTLEIEKRVVEVVVSCSTKTYLDEDLSIYPYAIRSEIKESTMTGCGLNLKFKRDVGEIVGKYNVSVVSYNTNYSATFKYDTGEADESGAIVEDAREFTDAGGNVSYVCDNVFEIVARKMKITLKVSDKTYDVSEYVGYETLIEVEVFGKFYEYNQTTFQINSETATTDEEIAEINRINNLIKNDKIILGNVKAKFKNKNVAQNKEITYYLADEDGNNEQEITFSLNATDSLTYANLILIKGEEKKPECYSISYDRTLFASIIKRTIRVFVINASYSPTNVELGSNTFTKRWASPDGKITFKVVDYVQDVDGNLTEVSLDEALEKKIIEDLEGQLSRKTIGTKKDKEGNEVETIFKEEIGTYAIELGNLGSSEENKLNYNISLREDQKFIITKRYITYEPLEAYSKTYGEDDPVFEAKEIFWGSIIPENHPYKGNELISGNFSRKEGEIVGKYLYTIGTLKISDAIYEPTVEDTVLYDDTRAVTKWNLSEVYEVAIKEDYFIISQREIGIETVSKEKVYGEATPNLECNITSGDLASKFSDNIVLSVLWNKTYGEECVGVHDIKIQICNLNGEDVTDCYYIIAQDGKLTITPASLTIGIKENLSKIYGELDPSWSDYDKNYVIKEGSLKRGDQLKTVLTGSARRDTGNDVKTYVVRQGTLKSNNNYALTFVEGTFTIYEKTIKIVADEKTLFVDEFEGNYELTYKYEKLAYAGDGITGKLALAETPEGEGTYTIVQGTLSAGNNYEIVYEKNYLTVKKRDLTITINALSKIYDGEGCDETKLSYTKKGTIAQAHGDSFFEGIKLSCPTATKNVGSYPIAVSIPATVKKYYDVKQLPNVFKITKRPIEIKTENLEKTYDGKTAFETIEKEQWIYEITSGTILNNEIEISFESNNQIQATACDVSLLFDGLSVKDYNAENAKNYQITYNPGKLTINKKEIVANVSNLTKTYGEIDPQVQYKFDEGAVVDGDVLLGKITRQAGENVGEYKYICNMSNPNYIITITEAKLKIIPRKVVVSFFSQDKVYDGTNNVETTYTISNIAFDDDIKVSANTYFCSPNVGNNVNVVVSNLRLVGEKASNYEIESNSATKASITYKSLSVEGITVTVDNNNTSLRYGTRLHVQFLLPEEIGDLGKDKNVESGILIQLYDGETLLTDFGTLYVDIDTTLTPVDKFDFFFIGDETVKIDHAETDAVVSFQTAQLGTFAIATYKNLALIYSMIGVGSAIGLGGLVWLAIFLVKKYKYR